MNFFLLQRCDLRDTCATHLPILSSQIRLVFPNIAAGFSAAICWCFTRHWLATKFPRTAAFSKTQGRQSPAPFVVEFKTSHTSSACCRWFDPDRLQAIRQLNTINLLPWLTKPDAHLSMRCRDDNPLPSLPTSHHHTQTSDDETVSPFLTPACARSLTQTT